MTITYLEAERRECKAHGKLLEFNLPLGGRPLLLTEKWLSMPEGKVSGFSRSHRPAQPGRMIVLFFDIRNNSYDAFLMMMDRNRKLVLSSMAQLIGRFDSIHSINKVEKSIAFDGYSNTLAVVNDDRIDIFGSSLH